MKIKTFLKDKFYYWFTFLIIYFILLFMFLAFKLDGSLIIAITFLLVLFLVITLSIEYGRKKSFYNRLLENIDALDKAYLVLETIEKPVFLEGKLLYQAIYEINKSMNECIKSLEFQMDDFKEYIEMWVHEIKIPIASLVLMTHNHKKKFDKKTLEQLKRIEGYVEQVLYYVRSENAEKDYLIKEVSLDKIINNVALKNKDDLLENHIDFSVSNVDFLIYTDSKWLEFIINQIINNSIKYRKLKNSYIKIEGIEEKDKFILIIEDNGIGIKESDIKHVFQKTFTGYNGRIMTKSTGMGLFIAKNLCQKLGHQIEIESVQNEYTKVFIKIAKNQFYEVIK